MDTLSQAKFDELIDLDIDSMSQEELAFLMARRSYMNAPQRERFAKTIKLHEEGKLFKKEKTASKDEVEDDLTGLGVKALVAIVKDEKLDIETKGMKAPELIEAIREAREADAE